MSESFKKELHSVLINLLNKQVANEKEKAFNFALALSQNETLQKAITSNNTQKSYIILKNYMKTIETFSGSQLKNTDSLKRLYYSCKKLGQYRCWGKCQKNRPDLEEVKQTLKAHLSFVAARRLVLIASIPIIEDGELIAFLEVIQRFGELEQYFSNYGVGLVVLLG
ncbi:MAG: hypothetical protein Q9M40_07610 [Sulfurimonas sp.]|nr:hypothetical protein [Sulfurimonas sp.]